jgi:hypothetical protein
MTTHSASERNREDQVFDRPLHLAGILDNAADELTQTFLFGYDWNDRSRCNCGTVAKQVMQTTSPKLKKLLPPIYADGIFYPTWGSMTEKYCSVTGLSKNEVFQRLFTAGLIYSDFSHLEDLSHPAILERMGPYRKTTERVSRSRKSDVVAYLRAWAVGIEEFNDHALVKSNLSTVS